MGACNVRVAHDAAFRRWRKQRTKVPIQLSGSAVGEQSQREGGGRGGEEDRYRVWLVSRGEHALHDIRGRRRVLFSQL